VTTVNVKPQIPIDRDQIARFGRKWLITELALFGSVLREDFRPDSDVDVLVRFAPQARWGLFDLCRMEEELRSMLGRQVDLVEREAVEQSENYIRRHAVLSTAEPVYVER
jgi:predicted nucleotidyltransferase